MSAGSADAVGLFSHVSEVLGAERRGSFSAAYQNLSCQQWTFLDNRSDSVQSEGFPACADEKRGASPGYSPA